MFIDIIPVQFIYSTCLDNLYETTIISFHTICTHVCASGWLDHPSGSGVGGYEALASTVSV